jgi:hypothetical protein
MPRFKRTAHRVSLAAMFSAMSLVFLYLSAILPTGSAAAYFLSSIFVMGLVVEEEIGLAFLMFATVSLLSLLIMPDLTRTVPYILFFGHYGIGKYYIERKFRDKTVSYVLKLLYYNAGIALIYFLAFGVFEQDILSFGIPLWAIIVIAEAAFVLYDFLFTKVTGYYFNNIRRLIMRD